MHDEDRYVAWFRGSAPYINTHRGRTFVIQFGGDALIDTRWVHDIALLNSLGIRLVLVHGARPQIERGLAEHHLDMDYADGLRVTDEKALAIVKEAVGAVRFEIEALLSKGLPSSPMAGADIRVTSGNLVTAKPIGIRDGVDFQYTGEVRRIDTESIRRQLDEGSIVLVSPIGYSPTGQLFNLYAEDVATVIAVELHAAKLLFLSDGPAITDEKGGFIRQLTLPEAESLLAKWQRTEARAYEDVTRHLSSAVLACQNGVGRTHVLDRRIDGVLLLELFTRDGVGTLVSRDKYEDVRRARIDDVGGILELIQPMEKEGILVRRSREKLEAEIGRFFIMERDGAAIACAAAHPCPDIGFVELACLAVHADYRNESRGAALLETIEGEARSLGGEQLFVLTTRAEHWFTENGFTVGDIEHLPVERQSMYNYQRNARVLTKKL